MTISEELTVMGNRLIEIADLCDSDKELNYIDLRDKLPHNSSADNPEFPQRDVDWAIVTEKTAITLHHIGAENTMPEGVAAWTCRSYYSGGKGLPRLQYHYWVARDGTIYYCVDEKFGFWHDHCGYPNSHLSVGMDGNLAVNPPTTEQLDATAKLLYWLMEKYGFTQDELKGHNAYAMTACPGWAKWETILRGLIDSYATVVNYAVEVLQKPGDELGK